MVPDIVVVVGHRRRRTDNYCLPGCDLLRAKLLQAQNIVYCMLTWAVGTYIYSPNNTLLTVQFLQCCALKTYFSRTIICRMKQTYHNLKLSEPKVSSHLGLSNLSTGYHRTNEINIPISRSDATVLSLSESGICPCSVMRRHVQWTLSN